VEVKDDQYPPELRQAEDALDKKDYAGAEKLLTTLTAKDPKNFRAWFDLGFLYNTQERTDDSIAAYRKAVAAKLDVFESNLNLGLMLARTGNQEAETFLRAATKLKPTDRGEEGRWLVHRRMLRQRILRRKRSRRWPISTCWENAFRKRKPCCAN
jgi:Flp pilus assembly protein TadD